MKYENSDQFFYNALIAFNNLDKILIKIPANDWSNLRKRLKLTDYLSILFYMFSQLPKATMTAVYRDQGPT